MYNKLFYRLMILLIATISCQTVSANHVCPTQTVTKAQPCKTTANETKGIASDKKKYEQWCKSHPGKCSKTQKMFD